MGCIYTVAQKGHTKLVFTNSTFFKLTFSELDVSNLNLMFPKFSHRAFVPLLSIDSIDGEAVPLAWGLLHAPTLIWNPGGPCDLGLVRHIR